MLARQDANAGVCCKWNVAPYKCLYDESKQPSSINGKCSPLYYKDDVTGCQGHVSEAGCENADGCCKWEQVTLAPTAAPVVVPTSAPVSIPPTPAAWHGLFANNKNCREHCLHCIDGIGSGCCDCGNFVGCGGWCTNDEEQMEQGQFTGIQYCHCDPPDDNGKTIIPYPEAQTPTTSSNADQTPTTSSNAVCVASWNKVKSSVEVDALQYIIKDELKEVLIVIGLSKCRVKPMNHADTINGYLKNAVATCVAYPQNLPKPWEGYGDYLQRLAVSSFCSKLMGTISSLSHFEANLASHTCRTVINQAITSISNADECAKEKAKEEEKEKEEEQESEDQQEKEDSDAEESDSDAEDDSTNGDTDADTASTDADAAEAGEEALKAPFQRLEKLLKTLLTSPWIATGSPTLATCFSSCFSSKDELMESLIIAMRYECCYCTRK